ncbi:MAG: beta-galactosidase trimerization domain-containing protein, partial [Nitrososphaerales archaeon]
ITERGLTAETLRGFRLLVIPHARHLRPEAVDAIEAYVAGGGALLFTYETATDGMTGQPLSQAGFGLVKIAGRPSRVVSFLEPSLPLSSTHLRVGETLEFEATATARAWATHVAPNIEVTREQWVSHNVAPGESTGRPAVISGEWGRGCYVYAAPRLFAEYVRQGLPALREFLEALLRNLHQPSVWVEVPSIVEAVFSRQDDDLVICLVNGLVGKPAFGGLMLDDDAPGYFALDEVLPVDDVRVHFPRRPGVVVRDGLGRPLPIVHAVHESIVTLARLDTYAVIRLTHWADAE